MSVDERHLAWWRQQQQANSRRASERHLTVREGRAAAMALAPEALGGQTSDNVEWGYRGMWQLSRLERWRIDDATLSHDAYLAWQRENGGEGRLYARAPCREQDERA